MAILKELSYDIAPKAGHWLGRMLQLSVSLSIGQCADGSVGDENPEWTANRVLGIFAEDEGIPSVDLSYLHNKVTLV